MVNATGNLAFVTLDTDYRVRRLLGNGLWVKALGREQTFFLVDLNTRLYWGGRGYTSWWIPVEVHEGDLVPVWDSALKVTGSTLRLVVSERRYPLSARLLLECWVLGFDSPTETLRLHYEKTTGFFVYLSFRYPLSTDTVVSGERALLETNLLWPAFTYIRPFPGPTLYALPHQQSTHL